ncbi:DUF2510 domain-containing protein [Microbacterium sp. ZW T5_45]|uniref:DUF2510 domain-containing protein n=1 Tax=Microbacterium sp. ZW T5_45 TaxID=3378080 RepID=UPI0038525A46
MTQPGWYETGTPGRERWWDGTAWSQHEREVAATAPPMGWYIQPGTDQERWWTGSFWSGYVIRRGVPVAEPFAVEPPGLGWFVGGMLALIAAVMLPLSLFGYGFAGLSGGFVVLGVMFMRGAAKASRRKKSPPPRTAALDNSVVRPLPGQQDGPDAGWYRLTANASRWWTGTTWAHYVSERGIVRPSHFGPRMIRNTQVLAMIVGGIGALLLVIGIVMAMQASLSASAAPGLIGVSVVLLFTGALMLLTLLASRRLSLLPTHPPAPETRVH